MGQCSYNADLFSNLASRKSSATAESIEVYNDLLNTARADLEDRLQRIDQKLELVVGQSVAESGSDASEVRLIQEERLSTEKCLQICAQLSDHISQIQLTAKRSTSHNEPIDSDILPQKITNEGLQECKDSLARTALKLERYEKQLFSRLIDKSKAAIISEEERADLARLRDEWEATRQGMDICSRAHEHLKDNVSTIDNYATGDAVQFMVSTSEKTIHGQNRGLGWRTRQVGGHISDESLQQITRTLTSLAIPTSGHEGPSPRSGTSSVPDDGIGNEPGSKFKDQYGRGFKLPSESIPSTLMSSTGSAEGRSSRSPKEQPFATSRQDFGANSQ